MRPGQPAANRVSVTIQQVPQPPGLDISAIHRREPPKEMSPAPPSSTPSPLIRIQPQAPGLGTAGVNFISLVAPETAKAGKAPELFCAIRLVLACHQQLHPRSSDCIVSYDRCHATSAGDGTQWCRVRCESIESCPRNSRPRLIISSLTFEGLSDPPRPFLA